MPRSANVCPRNRVRYTGDRVGGTHSPASIKGWYCLRRCEQLMRPVRERSRSLDSHLAEIRAQRGKTAVWYGLRRRPMMAGNG